MRRRGGTSAGVNWLDKEEGAASIRDGEAEGAARKEITVLRSIQCSLFHHHQPQRALCHFPSKASTCSNFHHSSALPATNSGYGFVRPLKHCIESTGAAYDGTKLFFLSRP